MMMYDENAINEALLCRNYNEQCSFFDMQILLGLEGIKWFQLQ